MGVRPCFEGLEGVCNVIPALAVKYFRWSECGVDISKAGDTYIKLGHAAKIEDARPHESYVHLSRRSDDISDTFAETRR